jgi:hypothetical protein
MSKIIIDVEFLYLVREGLSDEDGLYVKPKLNPCDIVFLKPSDMKVISESPEVPQTEDDLLKRLSEGCLCIGIKHHEDIAAYMWCNLRECDNTFIRFDLREDEAYLMDARTFSSYRGKNLAPYLRVELYRHLRQMRRTKFFSITKYSNMSARRFKKKLNAKSQKFYVRINLFMKYKGAIPLKSYKI